MNSWSESTESCTCKDSDFSEIICSQPALTSSFASSDGLVPAFRCTEHTHTQLLLHSRPRTVLSLHTKQPCPAEILTNLTHRYVAGIELFCPGLDYASPFTISSAPSYISSTPPQHTRLQNLNTLLCLLIHARDSWHRQNNIRRLSLHQSTTHRNATHSKVPLNFKDSAYSNSNLAQLTLTSGTPD